MFEVRQQCRLELNIYEMLRQGTTNESFQSLPLIIDTIDCRQGQLTWYIFSRLKRKILKRKKENTTVARIATHLNTLHGETHSNQPAGLLLVYQLVGTLSFQLLSLERTLQFLRGHAAHKNYTLLLISGHEIQNSLTKVYWTPNYCLCSSYALPDSEMKTEQYVDNPNTKQHISQVCLTVSLILEEKLNQNVKEMELLFVKSRNASQPLFLSALNIHTVNDSNRQIKYNCFKLPSLESPRNNKTEGLPCRLSRFSMATQPYFRSRSPSNFSFQCSSCREIFKKTECKIITKNRIHQLQLRNKIKIKREDVINEVVEDGMLRPSRNRRQFLTNYQQVQVCPSCYSKFIQQVREEEPRFTEPRNRAPSSIDKYSRASRMSAQKCTSVDISHDSLELLNRHHLAKPQSQRSKQVHTRTSATQDQEFEEQVAKITRNRRKK